MCQLDNLGWSESFAPRVPANRAGGYEVMSDSLTIRRAKQEDLGALAAFVQTASQSTAEIDQAVVTEWLFGKGLWVALQDGTLVGVAAWQVENLVSVTDMLYISPAQLWSEVGGRLLEIIEAEAMILMCEINAVLLPSWTSPEVRGILCQQGYEAAELEDLHRFWQEVLGDFADPESATMIKQLRDRMVMTPR